MCVGAFKIHLNEEFLMSTYNIDFNRKLTKKSFKLSSNLPLICFSMSDTCKLSHVTRNMYLGLCDKKDLNGRLSY